jgi:hypothetical protein
MKLAEKTKSKILTNQD